MVYIRVPTWKTGINPSLKHGFDQAGKFTPSQKMQLTRNRIWGNIIGGNERSGFSELKKKQLGPYLKTRYEFSQLQMIYPFVREWDSRNKLKEKYQDRKFRIFMRGIKIGQNKGGGKASEGMAVFEMAGKKKMNDAELGQKLGEASFSDDTLGISSDADA